MTALTMTSPTTGGALPDGVTAVGGIVLDLIGLNGVRVIVQVSADSLFNGVFDPSHGNPSLIGVLGGLSPQVLAQLGGGLSQMAVRMTVWDADASVGDVDHNDNFLTVNGIQIGNFSTVTTHRTSQNGDLLAQVTGFQNDGLNTGWFLVSEPGLLAQLYASLLSGNQARIGLFDRDPYDNGYDFTRGIRGSHFEVTSPNQAPDAVNDSYATSRNGQLTVNAANGVLANDTDPENANLTATLVQGPAHGTLTLNANGSFTYRPHAGYSGPDSFTYRTSDGALNDIATVDLTVDPNVAPVAGADAYQVDRNGSLTVNAAAGVLANDADPDSSSGGVITATVIEGPQHGTLTFNADGSFVYTPNPGYYGPDSFTYAASDGDDATPATVSLNVVNHNALPDARADNYELNKNGSLVVDAAGGVLANDTDADGNLAVEIVTGPRNGTLTLNADGSFTYTPNPGFHGVDTFRYRASDGLDSDVATVTLTVNNVNTAPVPGADVYQLNENGSLTVDAANGVLANDSDPDGSPITAQVRTQPRSGTLTLNSDGSFSYTPNPGFVGTDSFTYFANDGTDTGFATVTLVVNEVNEAPVGVADDYAVTQNGTLTIDAAHGVLANDSDPDGDALSATLLTGPRHGVFSLNTDGSFSYVPDTGYIGPDSFTYLLRDGTVTTPVTVTLNVNAPPRPVVTLDDTANVRSFSGSAVGLTIHALGGNDDITGTGFDDGIFGGDGNDNLAAGNGADTVQGGRGNDRIFGQGGTDTLEGGEGDDLLHGGEGDDTMIGGLGNDTFFVDSINDQVNELAGEGSDTVRSSVSYALGANLEALFLEGSANINGTGNALSNTVLGNAGANVLSGEAGDDLLNGAGGNDILLGGSGNDRLVGREGDDVLTGGLGDDTYYVDSMADQIVELAGEGWDTVFSTGSYIAHDNVDGVYLDGNQSINATGNALNNYLAGNAGDNVLDGGMGDDALNGGGGADTLIGGLGADRLIGGAGTDILRGGDGSDQLAGDAGDDIIHGGAGSDRLEGGIGNDTFLFNADDFVNLTGGPDNIVDFRGAGTSDIGEQDMLMLSGFGPGATLVFDHYGHSNSVQYYRIVDPGNPGVEHMILVQMAGTTNLLTASDYLFS